MIRSRQATGITIIVMAALVASSGAFVLAKRAIVEPVPDPTASNLGDETVAFTTTTGDDLAINATLACLASAGIMPVTGPVRGRITTRISVDAGNLDPEHANAAIERCGQIGASAALEITSGDAVLRAPAMVRQAAAGIFEHWLIARRSQSRVIDREPGSGGSWGDAGVLAVRPLAFD